jgi:hypothetical protein
MVIEPEEKKRDRLKPSKKMTDEDKRIQKDLDKAQAAPDQVQRKCVSIVCWHCPLLDAVTEAI